MDLENMSREELIEKLKFLEKQRAFTYEDQMKLVILDKSPFTIWASDRNCKITLWYGQCEALYGYSREHALGKDYINLFVARDEQSAARIDQLSIIDDGAVFHNIANDIGKNGNTLQLITNCFRIKDIKSGEFWNAEMGLIIDYLDQEKERLEVIVAESRKVKSSIDQFIFNTQQCKEHLLNRKKSLQSEITAGERKAVQNGKRKEFNKKVDPIKGSLKVLENSLFQLIDDYYEKLQDCASSDSCNNAKTEFDQKHDDMIVGFERIALDFEEINLEFDGDNTIFHLKESIFRENAERNKRLSNLAFEKLNRANEGIAEYQRMSTGNHPESSHYNKLVNDRDEIKRTKNEIEKVDEQVLKTVINACDFTILMNIRDNMLKQYAELEKLLV